MNIYHQNQSCRAAAVTSVHTSTVMTDGFTPRTSWEQLGRRSMEMQSGGGEALSVPINTVQAGSARRMERSDVAILWTIVSLSYRKNTICLVCLGLRIEM